jgi:hypothetical protein
MEVLSVTVPLGALRQRLARTALGERLADAQAAARRVRLAVGFSEAADPAAARVVGSVAPRVWWT